MNTSKGGKTIQLTIQLSNCLWLAGAPTQLFRLRFVRASDAHLTVVSTFTRWMVNVPVLDGVPVWASQVSEEIEPRDERVYYSSSTFARVVPRVV